MTSDQQIELFKELRGAVSAVLHTHSIQHDQRTIEIRFDCAPNTIDNWEGALLPGATIEYYYSGKLYLYAEGAGAAASLSIYQLKKEPNA
jgi:hypothetical protein